MVMGRLGRQLNNYDMVEGLDLSVDSLSISSPSRKLTAEKVFAAEAGRGAGDSGDDTESFNEEDCLFGDTHTEEDEAHGGGHYSKARSSVHAQPHSGCPRRAHSLRTGKRDGEITVAAELRASMELNSAYLQFNHANVDSEGDDAYKPAFRPSSKALAKLNTRLSGPNFASGRQNSMRQEKENENPCDENYGQSYGDKGFSRLYTEFGYGGELCASYDDRSSPVDIVPSSSSSPRTRRSRRAKKNMGSVRASLLAEAWERKRELMLNEELANFKDRPKPELLGRSSSDCGKLIIDAEAQTAELRRRSRTRSLTADDFDELRGCIDLGFRFDQSSVPDLCETLPALEVYCAVAQNFPDSPTCMSPVMQSPARCASPSPSASSWKISSPGDDPRDVKGRLKHWAQAVACNARHCY